jgi:hypothetical protein
MSKVACSVNKELYRGGGLRDDKFTSDSSVAIGLAQLIELDIKVACQTSGGQSSKYVRGRIC